jgi:hypothetical protein
MKKKIKDKVAIRIAAGVLLAALFAFTSCAVHTPNIQLPPRLVLQPMRACSDLEPLPFVKHSLAELEAYQAAAEHANPEREALEGMAAFQLNELLKEWGLP